MTYTAPDGYKPDVCVYHDPCADGFTAAWAVKLRYPDCEMRPGRYEPADGPNVAGKHVLLVDFSYKRPMLERIISEAASVTILDHHKSAQADLEPLLAEGVLKGEFDMLRSGAMMAWQFCYPEGVTLPLGLSVDYASGYVPWLVRYVQDRDIWTWKEEHAKEVTCWLNLLPLNFDHWSKACLDLEDADAFDKAVEIGAALTQKLEQDVATGIRATKRRMIIGGFDVPVANLPHFLASEAGNALCQGEPFAAIYYDTGDGRRSFSLRSDNQSPDAVDVSLVAVQYGGGGHKHASGFTQGAGWEGELSNGFVR